MVANIERTPFSKSLDTPLYIHSLHRNIWLRNTHYNFCSLANMLNIRSRGFDRTTVLLDICWKEYLIKFSKQIANIFAKIITSKGKFKTQIQNTVKHLRWSFFRKLLLVSEVNSGSCEASKQSIKN